MRRAVTGLRRAAIVLWFASGLSLVAAGPALAAIDLIVNSVSLSTSQLRPGESVGVTAVIFNAGINATSSVVPIYVAFHLSQDAGCSPPGPELTTEIIAGGIGGFGTRTVMSTMTIPGGTALGDHYVCVEVDSLDLVSEQNEGNNWNQAPLEVLECLIDAHCDDSIACTVDFCDGISNLCVNVPTNAVCDDGLFCTGVELCSGTLGCIPGTPPSCDDGIGCTIDTCDAAMDQCSSVPGDCDDGLFCNGQETCSPTLDCVAGMPPSCDDGISCTVDTCDPVADQCTNLPNDVVCDDGVFCDGAERCSPTQGCVAGTTPSCDDGVSCTVDACDVQSDQCANAPDDARCDDGFFCTGVESCSPQLGCVSGPPPVCDDGVDCTMDGCDWLADQCLSLPDDGLCDDGLFCNGAEICLASGCQSGTPVCDDGISCSQNLCDEGLDICSHPSLCSTAEFCTLDGCRGAPAFVGLGFIWDSGESHAWGVSADGQTAVGDSSAAAFQWRADSGMAPLDGLLAWTSSTARAVSDDGAFVVGGYGSGGLDQAFLWDATNGLTDLTASYPEPVRTSLATDVSADGSTIALLASVDVLGSPDRLLRWSAGGISRIPEPQYPLSATCNGDCTVIGGMMISEPTLAFGAFRAVGDAVTLIPPPPECGQQQDEGFVGGVSMSPDGSVVMASCPGWLFRWTAATGLVGTSIACTNGQLGGVAGDGQTVVGSCGGPGWSTAAAIWDPVNGLRRIDQLLEAYGLDLYGWELTAATDISADGRTIVGYGHYLTSGPTEAWMAVLGDPGIEDYDADGVDTSMEQGAPNGGDGNGDGLPDSSQANVTSLPAASGSGYITVEVAGACGQLSSVSTMTEAMIGTPDPTYDYPLGLVGFTAECPTATVTIYYHSVTSVAPPYRKFGPTTPGDPATTDWYSMDPSNTVYGSTWIGGLLVATVTLSLEDGLLGDDTGLDGRIVDAGGPTGAGPPRVPMLGVTGRALLVALLTTSWIGLSWRGRRPGAIRRTGEGSSA